MLFNFSLISLSIFITIVLNSVSGIMLTPFHLALFLEISLILSFGTCLFVSSFLLFPVCVLGRTTVSPGLGRVDLYSRCPIGPSGTALSVTQADCSRCASCLGCVYFLAVVEPLLLLAHHQVGPHGFLSNLDNDSSNPQI